MWKKGVRKRKGPLRKKEAIDHYINFKEKKSNTEAVWFFWSMIVSATKKGFPTLNNQFLKCQQILWKTFFIERGMKSTELSHKGHHRWKSVILNDVDCKTPELSQVGYLKNELSRT